MKRNYLNLVVLLPKTSLVASLVFGPTNRVAIGHLAGYSKYRGRYAFPMVVSQEFSEKAFTKKKEMDFREQKATATKRGSRKHGISGAQMKQFNSDDKSKLNLKKIIPAYLIFIIFIVMWGTHFANFKIGIMVGLILTIPSLLFIIIRFGFTHSRRGSNDKQ